MNRGIYLFILIIISFEMGSLSALEDTAGSINILLNNKYLLETLRLTSLAEESFELGDYDTTVSYAEEAMRYAQLSDIYVSLQLRIREVNNAIAVARDRLDWAASIDAAERYVPEYTQAQTAYGDACIARDAENWNGAMESASQVMKLLADIQELLTLPAQYVVQYWIPMKDCLWNIAGKPQIYGDPSKWRILYNANKNKLTMPDNPDLIHPGIVLDIPSINGEIRKGLLDETRKL